MKTPIFGNIHRYTQIVGHTHICPISHAEGRYNKYELEHLCPIWLCDNRPNQYHHWWQKFKVKTTNKATVYHNIIHHNILYNNLSQKS